MLQWGIDNELRSPPRKKQGAEFGRVGTPLPSSPFSPPCPGSSKSKGSVSDRFIPRRSGNIPDGFSLFDQRQVCSSSLLRYRS